MIDIQDILQAKYELGGRGPDCYDCYGLVREMYRRCGKEILILLLEFLVVYIYQILIIKENIN